MDTALYWIKRYWLDCLNFGVACGNAELIEMILVESGRSKSTLLTIAVFCSELILATAGIWGKRGILIAVTMFLTSLWGIHHIFPTTWIVQSYFSITIFVGTLTSLMGKVDTPTTKVKWIPLSERNYSWLWSWAFKTKTNTPLPTTELPIVKPSTWPLPIGGLQLLSNYKLSKLLQVKPWTATTLLNKWKRGEVVEWQWVVERQV